jgi:hypothetical protein
LTQRCVKSGHPHRGLESRPLERPVAIFATMMAAPITSAGRFSPRGALGIGTPRKLVADCKSCTFALRRTHNYLVTRPFLDMQSLTATRHLMRGARVAAKSAMKLPRIDFNMRRAAFLGAFQLGS